MEHDYELALDAIEALKDIIQAHNDCDEAFLEAKGKAEDVISAYHQALHEAQQTQLQQREIDMSDTSYIADLMGTYDGPEFYDDDDQGRI